MIAQILSLMERDNITANRLTKELHLPSSAITEWKKGKARPSTDAVIKLAQYFGVTTDYLLTGKESAAPTAGDLAPDEMELLTAYRSLSEKGKTMARAYIYSYLDDQPLPPVQIAAKSGARYDNAPQPDLETQMREYKKYKDD